MNILRDILRISLLVVLTVLLWNTWNPSQPLPSAEENKALEIQGNVLSTSPISLETSIPPERLIAFETDVLRGVIDKQGGHLVYLALLKYPETLPADSKEPTKPFVLLDHSTDRYYVARSNLVLPNALKDDTSLQQYESECAEYKLLDGKESLVIPLYIQTQGVTIRKCWVFKRGQYHTDIQYQVNNQGEHVWRTRPYAELKRYAPTVSRGWFSPADTNISIVSSDSKAYEKIPLDSIGRTRLPQKTQHAWLAFSEPYFTSAWVSRLPSINYYSYRQQAVCTLGMLGEWWEIAPGATQESMVSLYVGPKIADVLKSTAKHLDLIVDYGMFWFVVNGLFWLLKQCYQLLGNWGWAIVCVTFLIKLCFITLSHKSIRFMLIMPKLQPRLDALKVQYKDNPMKLFQAQKDLYRQSRISPMSNFLTIFIQISLWIGFRVVMESVEFRYEPFIFWIKDLSALDPYYVLPILAGLTIWWGNQLTPSQGINSSLLLLSFFIFFNVSSGFVLFLLVDNLFSTLQKWWILGRPGLYFWRKQV
jgi:YidC/Oxa1 family membrane protein insertase